MKSGWLLVSALSATLLGGCATATGETLHGTLANADAVPK